MACRARAPGGCAAGLFVTRRNRVDIGDEGHAWSCASRRGNINTCVSALSKANSVYSSVWSCRTKANKLWDFRDFGCGKIYHNHPSQKRLQFLVSAMSRSNRSGPPADVAAIEAKIARIQTVGIAPTNAQSSLGRRSYVGLATLSLPNGRASLDLQP